MSRSVSNTDGAEWHIPPIKRLFEASFYAPITISLISFYIINQLIQKNLWTRYKGETKYRLQNLSVSLIHSTITGGTSLIFTILNPDIIFADTIHWYCSCAAQLVHLSMGYFVYDTYDVLRQDRSVYAMQITAHHIAAFVIFSVGMLPQKFLPYAYSALLVEVNCIFLHIRTLMQLSGNNIGIRYQVARFLSIITFIIFRFGVLSWMLYFIVTNRHRYHLFYCISGMLATTFFLAFSAVLFREVLSDRVVGSGAVKTKTKTKTKKKKKKQ